MNALARLSESMAEVALRELRRRILDNVWPPGYQALEQELALTLGMSRTPIHEALICLQNEGLVEVIPRRGMRVLPVSAEDMREIYEVLTALECAAVEMVALRQPGEQELRPLADATRDMAMALEDEGAGLEAWAAADERFHKQLLVLCGNRQLHDTVLNYWDRAHRARMFTLKLRAKPVNSTQEHLALVERLRAGDVQGAVAINKAHRQRASAELLSIFERFNLQQM
ncbi:MAG: GntR family transcriptional regulator [Burkholderiaceae bacterium]